MDRMAGAFIDPAVHQSRANEAGTENEASWSLVVRWLGMACCSHPWLTTVIRCPARTQPAMVPENVYAGWVSGSGLRGRPLRPLESR